MDSAQQTQTANGPLFFGNPDINFFKKKNLTFGIYTGYTFKVQGGLDVIINFTQSRPKERVIPISSQYVKEKNTFFDPIITQANRIFTGVRFEFYILNLLNDRSFVIVPIPKGN